MSRATFLLVLVGLMGCGASVPATVRPPVGKTSSSQSSLPLTVTMDLGVVVQGTSVELRYWVKNQGKTPIEASKISSSCECLTVRLSKTEIAAGERVLAYLHYDGAKEAEFVGSLQIEVELMDAKGTKVGQIDVPIEVVRAEAVGNARD